MLFRSYPFPSHDRMSVNVKEKLAEYTDDLKKVYKKAGYTKKVMAEKGGKKK